MEGIQKKSKFIWAANQAAVDFINTDIVADGVAVDLLVEARDVVEWLREAGFLGKAASVTAPKGLLEEARAYRVALREGIARLANGRGMPETLLTATNNYLARGAAWEQLEKNKAGYRSATRYRLESPPDFMVPIAESFRKLVSEGDLTRLRKCKNPECVLYFFDISKGGQRAWHSLETCGNKMRMAEYRRRNQGG